MARLYRAKTLRAIHADLRVEIEWLNPTALQHLKNYQIWHHRQTIVDALDSPAGEADFIATMLEQDSKNYHVWSYRQWLVQRFNLFDDDDELRWTETMIDDDVRNNSAWNHRWYLVVGGHHGRLDSKHLVSRELEYVLPCRGPPPFTLHITADPSPAMPNAPSEKHPRTRVHGITSKASFVPPAFRPRASRILPSNSPICADQTTSTPATPSIFWQTSMQRKRVVRNKPRRPWTC